MKILVFSDIHGLPSGADAALKIYLGEKPDKTVLCGDVYDGGYRSDKMYTAEKLSRISPLYVAKGNNDYSGDEAFSPFFYTDNVILRAFNRTLFFTHGHVYNSLRLPPVLGEGDALIYGHTHTGGLFRVRGIYAANVGSLSLPRSGVKNYLTIENDGFRLKNLDGETISALPFD